MASDISTNFANLTARTEILIDATNALQEATRRFDAKLDLLMEASFKAGWEQLELAAGASNESRCERYLERYALDAMSRESKNPTGSVRDIAPNRLKLSRRP